MEREFNRRNWLATDEALVSVKDGDHLERCLGLRLIEVVQRGEPRRADLLIKAGADVNAQDQEGMTPLHHAAAYGSRACLRLLVATEKCDYTMHDRQYRYASDIAIEWGRDYAVGRLLSKHQRRQAFERGIPTFVFRPRVVEGSNPVRLV